MSNSSTDSRRNGVKPPWISKADLQTFLDRSQNLGAPRRLDTAWVTSYQLAPAHPDSVVSALKWLGVVAADHSVDTKKWNALRVQATRESTLKGLTEESYAPIFAALDVASATQQDLAGAFIQEYSVGDTARQVRAFLALCEHSGIRQKAGRRQPRSGTRGVGLVQASATDLAPVRKSKDRDKVDVTPREISHSVHANVEVPAEWDESRIRERLASVKRILDSLQTDG